MCQHLVRQHECLRAVLGDPLGQTAEISFAGVRINDLKILFPFPHIEQESGQVRRRPPAICPVHPMPVASFAIGREGITEPAAFLAQRQILGAHQVGNLDAVVEAGEGIRPTARLCHPRGAEQTDVALEQLPQVAEIAKPEPVLVSRDAFRPVGLDAAEMEESEGLAIHADLVADLDAAAVEVPVRHVVARMVNDAHIGIEAGDEIDPLLVDEQPLLHTHDAALEHPVLPPRQEPVDRPALREADEPQVVSP